MTKTNDPKVGAAQKELRSAFDDLIADLQAARDTIDDPQFFPPAATERVLAEGYRYLAGFVHHGIERAFHEDPDFPAASREFNESSRTWLQSPRYQRLSDVAA